MKAQLLITFATYREAVHTIKMLEAIKSDDPNLFTFAEGYLLVTGMGMLAAASQTAQHLPFVQEIWNLGIAGALHDTTGIGTICEIQNVSKFLYFPDDIDSHSHQFSSSLFSPLSLSSHGSCLVSTDFPIHNLGLRTRLASSYHLVDMEGYGIAFTASRAKIKCRMWKLISDFASSDGQKLIAQHIDRLSEQFSTLVLSHLNTKLRL